MTADATQREGSRQSKKVQKNDIQSVVLFEFLETCMVAKVIRNGQCQLRSTHEKVCVMAVPANVGKPTRKVAGIK